MEMTEDLQHIIYFFIKTSPRPQIKISSSFSRSRNVTSIVESNCDYFRVCSWNGANKDQDVEENGENIREV